MRGVKVRTIGEMRSSEDRFHVVNLGLWGAGQGATVIRLPPNCDDYPAHDDAADDQDAADFVLAGRAVLESGGDWITLRPGSFAIVAPSVTRKLVGGDEGATVLALGAKPQDAVARSSPQIDLTAAIM